MPMNSKSLQWCKGAKRGDGNCNLTVFRRKPKTCAYEWLAVDVSIEILIAGEVWGETIIGIFYNKRYSHRALD